MSTNNIKRLIWFITLMQRNPNGLTKEQLDAAWVARGFNEDYTPKRGEPSSEMPRGTFYRLIDQAKDIFDIEITRKGLIWSIEYDSSAKNEVKKQLLTSLSVFELVHGNKDLMQHIILEDVPSGNDHLETVIRAISDLKVLFLTYLGFVDDLNILVMNVKVMGLRLFNRRWYLVGVPTDETRARLNRQKKAELGLKGKVQYLPEIFRNLERIEYCVLPLDRIIEAKITGQSYEMPVNLNLKDFFADYVGPYVDGEIKEKKVVVHAYGTTGAYIDSLPIHPSQRLVEVEYPDYLSMNSTEMNEYLASDDDTEERWVFEYDLRPTHYFYQELMKYGPGVEIISPDDVRQEMKSLIEKALYNYNHKYGERFNLFP